MTCCWKLKSIIVTGSRDAPKLRRERQITDCVQAKAKQEAKEGCKEGWTGSESALAPIEG